MPENIPAPVRYSRLLALAATAALIMLGLGWELWWAPLRPGGSWLALKVLPLLAVLPGLWRYRMYTYRAASLLLWLYCLEGLVRATSEIGLSSGLAWTEVLLSMLLFWGCVWQIRSRLRGPKKASQGISERTS